MILVEQGKNGSSYKIDYVSSLHAAHMSATGENNLQINSADFLSSGEKPVSSVHCKAKRERVAVKIYT